MNVFRDDALANFGDREYRESYWEEFLNVWIATQIRTLREQRRWSQEALAQKAGMKQSRISTLENVDYSSWSVNTLKRLAKAFDVTLAVEFRSYGERLEDFERFERRDLLAVPFDEDPVFHPRPLENTAFQISADEMTRGLRQNPWPAQTISTEAGFFFGVLASQAVLTPALPELEQLKPQEAKRMVAA